MMRRTVEAAVVEKDEGQGGRIYADGEEGDYNDDDEEQFRRVCSESPPKSLASCPCWESCLTTSLFILYSSSTHP
jgi:hypothetical protein